MSNMRLWGENSPHTVSKGFLQNTAESPFFSMNVFCILPNNSPKKRQNDHIYLTLKYSCGSMLSCIKNTCSLQSRQAWGYFWRIRAAVATLFLENIFLTAVNRCFFIVRSVLVAQYQKSPYRYPLSLLIISQRQ